MVRDHAGLTAALAILADFGCVLAQLRDLVSSDLYPCLILVGDRPHLG